MKQLSLKEAFARDGVVRVRGMVAAAALEPMQRVLHKAIAELPFLEISGALRPARGTELPLWEIGRDPAFSSLSDVFTEAIARVFGPGQWEPVDGEEGGLAMPNLPRKDGEWTACAAAWHVDEPTPASGERGEVLLGFILIDDVVPQGGGTVVLAGSHLRLAMLATDTGRDTHTDVALAELADAEPWFATLLARDAVTLDGVVSEGIPMHLYEIAGNAGDVILMNPRCLHTTAANVASRARLLMRTTAMRIG